MVCKDCFYEFLAFLCIGVPDWKEMTSRLVEKSMRKWKKCKYFTPLLFPLKITVSVFCNCAHTFLVGKYLH